MASFKINSDFSTFINSWRKNGGTCPFHTGQIEYGEAQRFMGAWV